jgi:hypothetical protein
MKRPAWASRRQTPSWLSRLPITQPPPWMKIRHGAGRGMPGS